MRFVPYDQLADQANIIVDGTSHPGTQVILSHWRASGTPKHLLADTSTEIVFKFLESGSIPPQLECVSNDHFDQDGLIGIFALLLNPEYSLRHKRLLIDIAEAGDFSKFKNRMAARVSFAIAEMVERITSAEERNRQEPKDLCGHLYQVILPQLQDMIDHIDRYEEYWKAEDEFLRRSEENIKQGRVKIVENKKTQVAIVDLSPDLENEPYHWATFKKKRAVHEMAIHNQTSLTQLVYRQGKRFWFQYRYESWVTFQSAAFPLRGDLAPLSSQLNALEKDSGTWRFSGADALVPTLSREAESGIDFDVFLNLLHEALRTAPVAWDPFLSRPTESR